MSKRSLRNKIARIQNRAGIGYRLWRTHDAIIQKKAWPDILEAARKDQMDLMGLHQETEALVSSLVAYVEEKANQPSLNPS